MSALLVPWALVRVVRLLPPIESRHLVDGGLRGWIRISESPAFVSCSGVCGASGTGRDKWDAAVIVRRLHRSGWGIPVSIAVGARRDLPAVRAARGAR